MSKAIVFGIAIFASILVIGYVITLIVMYNEGIGLFAPYQQVLPPNTCNPLGTITPMTPTELEQWKANLTPSS